MTTEHFYFDDFFIADDDGVVHELRIKGRLVPIKFKRSFTLDDIQAAQSASIKTKLNPATKSMDLVDVDHAKFLRELVPRAIVSWPFTTREGKKVPINKTTCGQLILDAGAAILSIVERMTEEVEAHQDTNFSESRSGGGS
jgi:hypothetical protein